MFSKLIEAARHFLALIEANYHYEILDVKRWVADEDACELCQENADRGWIPDDDVFEGVFGPVDGPEGHPHCLCELEYGEKRKRVYD